MASRVHWIWCVITPDQTRTKTFSGLFQNFLRTFSVLSQTFLRTLWGNFHDFLRTFQWFSEIFYSSILSPYLHKQISQDFFMTFTGILKNVNRTFTDFSRSFPRLSKDLLRTFSGLFQNQTLRFLNNRNLENMGLYRSLGELLGQHCT